jgi:3-hydroxyisobutyrate dehydrogenase-like beta-hydroxyacid dehydrogenase
MNVGVLGTGMVGHAFATRLVELGHEVTMGSRQAGNEKAVAWAQSAGERGYEGTFADAAAFGELIVHCTAGMHSSPRSARPESQPCRHGDALLPLPRARSR